MICCDPVGKNPDTGGGGWCLGLPNVLTLFVSSCIASNDDLGVLNPVGSVSDGEGVSKVDDRTEDEARLTVGT